MTISDCIEEHNRAIHRCHTINPKDYGCRECEQDCIKELTECPAGIPWEHRMSLHKTNIINVAPFIPATREELEQHLGKCYDCHRCPDLDTCKDRTYLLVQCVHCGENMQLPYPVDPNYPCDSCGQVWCKTPLVRRELQTTLEGF